MPTKANSPYELENIYFINREAYELDHSDDMEVEAVMIFSGREAMEQANATQADPTSSKKSKVKRKTIWGFGVFRSILIGSSTK